VKRKRFAVEQIVAVLKQGEATLPVAELIRKVGISEQTPILSLEEGVWKSGGLPKIRRSTSIAQHIRPAALSAENVPTFSTLAELSRQFCGALQVVIHPRAGHHGTAC
jgi:hypothetical protein